MQKPHGEPESTEASGLTPSSRARAWQRMLSGRRLDLLSPSPTDIEIEDIAHGLARLARWNGQTLGPCAFSVAQHALVVEEIACALNPGLPARWQLAALLHDAAEYVIGDLISPFKTAIGLDYRAFEVKLLDAIHRRFGVPAPLPQNIAGKIKDADRIAAYFEATILAGFDQEEAREIFGQPQGINHVTASSLERLCSWPAATAQRAFLQRFETICRGL